MRELVAEQHRSAPADPPSLIEDHVGEQIQKLEGRFLSGFRLPGALRYSTPRIERRTGVIKAARTEADESKSRHGFCPNCTSTNIRRAHKHEMFEEFLRLFFIAPFRCRACQHKFYRF